MREGIHPDYYQAKVVCNCGNEFVTGSTKEDIHVEICSKCHSFYTGQQKAAQARGRIDKFNRKYGVTQAQYEIRMHEGACYAYRNKPILYHKTYKVFGRIVWVE